jgi:hypothetical protein
VDSGSVIPDLIRDRHDVQKLAAFLYYDTACFAGMTGCRGLTVIPAKPVPAKAGGGNPVIPWLLLDSGSPLRCGRNDVLCCRVNNRKEENVMKFG